MVFGLFPIGQARGAAVVILDNHFGPFVDFSIVLLFADDRFLRNTGVELLADLVVGSAFGGVALGCVDFEAGVVGKTDTFA